MLNLHNAEFVRSAVRRSDFPNDPLPQIVFAGKSNVGKSSTINKLLNRKNFARVGNEPGKTIHINFFCIDQKAYFVDLPGYGYAKVSKKERDRWGALMEEYFAEEDAITLGFQIVDARHKPTADDVVMADWFLQSGVPFAVIANKHDKLKKSAVEDSMNTISTTLHLPEDVPVIPFSAVKGTGRDEVLQMIFDHVSGSQP